MIPRLALIVVMIVLAAGAQAQLLNGISRTSSAGGSVTPPSCNNSLDFTQACNSVYIAVIL